MPFDDPALPVPIAGDGIAPTVPSSFIAVPSDRLISLGWSDSPESDVAYYNVWWADNVDGPYELLGTTTVSEFVHSGVSNGTTYWYKVSVVDDFGYESALIGPISATPIFTEPTDTTPPEVPVDLSATAGDQQIVLDWLDSAAFDFNHFRVYRATASGGPYTQITTRTTSSYVDTGLTNGTAYWYKVSAVDQQMNESAQSSSATATPAQVGSDTTPPPIPTGLFATAGDQQIALDWANSPAPDLASYKVYRTLTGGSFVSIATRTVSDYINTGLANGTTYYYRVTALDLTGNESVPSAVISAVPTGAATGNTIPAGASIQAAVNASPTGTTFLLAAGTWTGQEVRPKTGQKFIGALSGSTRLSILDGMNVASMAFAPGGTDVTIKNIVITRYAAPNVGGFGAIKTTNNWIMDNIELKESAWTGVYIESGVQIRNSFIHHNGKVGCGAFRAVNHIFENNEVSFNNTKLWNQADEGGGKWVATTNCIMRNNNFHHNYDTGIWFDSENVNALIENNISSNNTNQGIHFEISCSGVIRNNIVDNNAQAGIFINASRNVDCYSNTVRNNGKGIHVWAQNRGTGANCVWLTDNVDVYDNFIQMNTGFTGLQRGPGQGTEIYNGTVRFTNNDYDVPTPAGSWFQWQDSLRTWSQWQAYGQDTTGSIV